MLLFLITARKKLESECCIGDHKFSNVPKSLFTEDAAPLACKDKWTIMNIIENLENSEFQIPCNAHGNSALIIYGMPEIVKDKSMKTLQIYIFFVLIIPSLTPNSPYKFLSSEGA